MQALLDALTMMERPTDAVRVFHGRSGRFPGCEGWSLDAYPPVWLLTRHEPASESELDRFGAALTARWAQIAPGEPLHWVFQQRDEARATNRLMAGDVPAEHEVSEDGARYRLHLMRGLNHGLFLDMREGRRWVRQWASRQPGQRVLNLFAYSCAFSVAALQGGAAEVHNYDMAPGALALGQRNHRLNGLERGASFFSHDVFASWGKIRRAGPYDLVICDPPSYQKGSFVATKDYARLVRRLPELIAPDGHALLCLNSPRLGSDFLCALVQAEAPELDFIERLPNPPAFADVDEERSLKVLVFRRSRAISRP